MILAIGVRKCHPEHRLDQSLADRNPLISGRNDDRYVIEQGIPEHPVADPVRIELWVEELRPSRFVLSYELFDSDAVASRARSVCVPFDLDKGRPRRLSAAERDFLTPWLA